MNQCIGSNKIKSEFFIKTLHSADVVEMFLVVG